MNREDIIRMAWQAGFAIVDKHILADNENGPEHVICTKAINRFAALVAAAEREACAKEAEDSDHVVLGRGYHDQLGDADATARNIAAAIRARSSNAA